VVLTEGKRDEKTGEVRKTRLFLFSEDFAAFFKCFMNRVFVRENPVPPHQEKARPLLGKQERERRGKNKNAIHSGIGVQREGLVRRG